MTIKRHSTLTAISTCNRLPQSFYQSPGKYKRLTFREKIEITRSPGTAQYIALPISSLQ